MKHILVTGGAGYIGSSMVNYLINNKKKVIVLDNLYSGSKRLINKKAIFINLDIRDQNLFENLKKYNIDTIFHFAALTDVSESKKKPTYYYDVNVLGTKNILKLAGKLGVNNFIFSSTAAVYGSKKTIVSETDKTKPESNYGKNKLISEFHIKEYCKEKKINYAILRYFNVVGSSKKILTGQLKKGSLFKNLSHNIVRKKFKISIFGKNYSTKDGTCLRDFIDINDLINIHFLILKKLKQKKAILINCGYNQATSLLEIVKLFSKVSKKNIKIIYENNRIGDIISIKANNNKFLKMFPKWRRNYTLRNSVKSSLDWEKKIFSNENK